MDLAFKLLVVLGNVVTGVGMGVQSPCNTHLSMDSNMPGLTCSHSGVFIHGKTAEEGVMG